ncbi:MAG: hypothetical protein ACC662_09405, partial [Planctomycetota bacterium]
MASPIHWPSPGVCGATERARARPGTRAAFVLSGAFFLLLLASCAHSFSVESRDTPVHVWLAVPEFACEGGLIDPPIR